MSTSYEPQPFEPPDLEQAVAAHLRSLNLRPGTVYGRVFPGDTQALPNLPAIIGGITYTAAVVVRDDGGRWPTRLLSVSVVGSRDASYADTRALAAQITGRLADLAAQNLPIAAVTAVRGPLSVADTPPEFHTTADLVVVG